MKDNYNELLNILKTIYNEDIANVISYSIKDLVTDINKIENESKVLTIHEKETDSRDIKIEINSADNAKYINKGMAHLSIDETIHNIYLELVANEYGVKVEAKYYVSGNLFEIYFKGPNTNLDSEVVLHAYHYIKDVYGKKELMDSTNENITLKEGLDLVSNLFNDKSLLQEKFGEII